MLLKHADKEPHKSAIVRAEEFKRFMSGQQHNIQQRCILCTVQCHVYYYEWLRTRVVHVTHDIGMQNITRKLVANISPDFPCVLKAKRNRVANHEHVLYNHV